MINQPVCIVRDDFQTAWLEAARQVLAAGCELRNVIVQIKDTSLLDPEFHTEIESFSEAQGLLGPKHVAYTIFPHGLYQGVMGAEALFTAYNRQGGLYERLRRRKRSWGTYFQRMTNYVNGKNEQVNQLRNIIGDIRDRERLYKAAYTIVIQTPGQETVRPRGGPCLNYIAIQAERGAPGGTPTLGLLAVYRNHDFLERAYGNYWGLCNLLMFLADEVGGSPGPLTCISSHAYVDRMRGPLRRLAVRLC